MILNLISFIFSLSIMGSVQVNTCHFKPISPESFELSFQGKKTKIFVSSKEAKLEACHIDKRFPGLLITEINLGHAGTSSQISQTDLVIFATKGAQLKKIFQDSIRDISQRKDTKSGKIETNRYQRKYELKAQKNGKALVRFLDSAEKYNLKY